mmetsp:Transcript_1751/g.3528  ORF Transcript_1751/g.3528 Transcript_1751/m.3528 type:complete len:183 (-) Transcript_1751:314-862(-)|eukprot:CAMPEP_0174750966 /NCGR_PEP_ID=MMETSP1094-20130205/98858_1 /TAXON_ID=156173 /ORGANISM="Chrysochromulina brevifilum, Strain UTEX LB 985" /LENGTH=182 /DNA_ID=CAMNT_0015956387 /DNA_START=23 /DNA_END=571 /DNA_ORIENTATION=+
MPALNYSKWDNLDDSDDEAPPPPRIEPAQKRAPSKQSGSRGSATVAAGFILKTTAHDGKEMYINVCSSNAVEGNMSATPSSKSGLNATLPFIVGDMRSDTNSEGDSCYVVEALFHPDTIARADKDKQTAETVITTALAVVSQHATLVDQKAWSIFEPAALRETTGAYFFAPGKLTPANAGIE